MILEEWVEWVVKRDEWIGSAFNRRKQNEDNSEHGFALPDSRRSHPARLLTKSCRLGRQGGA